MSSAPPPPIPADAPPGSFWQVGAWRQAAGAEPTLQMLKDGGMPATLRSGTDGLVHVVVGPYGDVASLSRAKNELETRFGIRNMIRK